MQRLMDEFDEINFLDDKGEFKPCEENLSAGIRRVDLNDIGGNTDGLTKTDEINGFNAQDLIELQNANLDSSMMPKKKQQSPGKTDPSGPSQSQRSTGHTKTYSNNTKSTYGSRGGVTGNRNPSRPDNSWQHPQQQQFPSSPFNSPPPGFPQFASGPGQFSSPPPGGARFGGVGPSQNWSSPPKNDWSAPPPQDFSTPPPPLRLPFPQVRARGRGQFGPRPSSGPHYPQGFQQRQFYPGQWNGNYQQVPYRA